MFNLEGDASGTEGARVIRKEVPLQSSTSVKDERHGIKKDSLPRIDKTQDRPKQTNNQTFDQKKLVKLVAENVPPHGRRSIKLAILGGQGSGKTKLIECLLSN